MALEERERWDKRYQSQIAGPTLPHPALDKLRWALPDSGRFLDAGGGTGRNSIWAAEQGFEVTLADVSKFGIDLANNNAKAAEVKIQSWCVDLDLAEPSQRWDVVLCANFLQPALLDNLSRWLEKRGTFVMLHPTIENLTRHEKPSRRYLITPEEVVTRLPPHELLHFDADWRADGRHEMELVCRLVSE